MRRNRSGCLRWVVLIIFGGIVVYIFRFEIGFLRDFFVTIIRGHPIEGFPEISQALRLTLFISLNLLAILFFVILVLYWIASSSFPVRNNFQVYLLMRQIVGSILKRNRPASIVREGILIGKAGEVDSSTLLLDLESSVVVESLRLKPPPASLKSGKHSSLASVRGPGLVLLSRGEKLRDVVHLRKQFRFQPNILGQTSDGIELSTHTFALFTLSQPPDVIQVAYDGDQNSDNLRVVRIDINTRKIVAIDNELDGQDKREIHDFSEKFLFNIEPNSPLDLMQIYDDAPPYSIDEARILASVYSRARNVGDHRSLNRWTDLPVMVSIETFRNLIAGHTLDGLYFPEDPVEFPLYSRVKPEFARRIRYMGVMNYQFIHRIDGEQSKIGQRVDHRYYRISSIQTLHGSKMLRDRGIKIITAGFGELTPTDPDVSQQRVKNWRARWQQEANMILASQDQELIRIKGESRAKKEREIEEKLSSLLQDPTYSEEMLARQIYQELEKALNEPLTRERIPRETINQLRSIRHWLLPEENSQPELTDNPQGESQGDME
jgi:hypothetical protein